MPYLTGITPEVEKGLLAHFKYNLSLEAVVELFGHDVNYWYRLTSHLGRYDLVSSTVFTPENLPQNLVADEKHYHQNSGKGFAAMTVGENCVLGLGVAHTASTADLTEAYGVFQREALAIDPSYQPESVNTDGWSATQQAWRLLFPAIIILECFLHAFIRIKNCCRSLAEPYFEELCDEVWRIYHAASPAEFSSQLGYVRRWAKEFLHESGRVAVEKLAAKADSFVQAYDHPEAHRTSNMVDRHMHFFARWLTHSFYCRGSLKATERRFRAWALVHNFAPFTKRSMAKRVKRDPALEGYTSPVHQLNGKVYHQNWLENLLVATSRSAFLTSHKIRTT
jgi:hypothetical protein